MASNYLVFLRGDKTAIIVYVGGNYIEELFHPHGFKEWFDNFNREVERLEELASRSSDILDEETVGEFIENIKSKKLDDLATLIDTINTVLRLTYDLDATYGGELSSSVALYGFVKMLNPDWERDTAYLVGEGKFGEVKKELQKKGYKVIVL